MKLFTILVLLSITSAIFGQNYLENAHRIDDTEKKRLENQFKALRTFYIDDSGLVVYQNQESDNSGNSDVSTQEETPKNVREAKPAKKVNREQENTQDIPVVVKKTMPGKTVSQSETNMPTERRESANTTYVKKATTETEGISVKRIDQNEIQTDGYSRNQMNNIPPSTKAEKEEVIKPKVTISKNKGNSILNRKRASKYKTMEEAALAVEALLDELKKEQVQTTSAGSMSSKLSRGVTKNLRKKAGQVSGNYHMDSSSNPDVKKEVVVDDEFGDEPSYFINGKQVDKIEVNKLRKKDIINKEIRIRNTVTGNPNGEVWYEVKEEALE